MDLEILIPVKRAHFCSTLIVRLLTLKVTLWGSLSTRLLRASKQETFTQYGLFRRAKNLRILPFIIMSTIKQLLKHAQMLGLAQF